MPFLLFVTDGCYAVLHFLMGPTSHTYSQFYNTYSDKGKQLLVFCALTYPAPALIQKGSMVNYRRTVFPNY